MARIISSAVARQGSAKSLTSSACRSKLERRQESVSAARNDALPTLRQVIMSSPGPEDIADRVAQFLLDNPPFRGQEYSVPINLAANGPLARRTNITAVLDDINGVLGLGHGSAASATGSSGYMQDITNEELSL